MNLKHSFMQYMSSYVADTPYDIESQLDKLIHTDNNPKWCFMSESILFLAWFNAISPTNKSKWSEED